MEMLLYIVDNNIRISRRTFLKNVGIDNVKELEDRLGYWSHHRKGMTMAQDYHVSYHRAKYEGETVYYVRHSAIEYVFRKGE